MSSLMASLTKDMRMIIMILPPSAGVLVVVVKKQNNGLTHAQPARSSSQHTAMRIAGGVAAPHIPKQ